jgi:hypothetical protein
MSDLERLVVLVPAEVKEALKQQAVEKGLNLSSLVRLLLVEEAKKDK